MAVNRTGKSIDTLNATVEDGKCYDAGNNFLLQIRGGFKNILLINSSKFSRDRYLYEPSSICLSMVEFHI